MAMNLDELLKEWRKKRHIICPYCGNRHEPSGDMLEKMENLITYWGEEEPQVFECDECRCVFFVKEHLERTFEEKKTYTEFD